MRAFCSSPATLEKLCLLLTSMEKKKFTRTRGADRRGRFNRSSAILTLETVNERLIFLRDCGKIPDSRTLAIRRALLRDFQNLEGKTNEDVLQKLMPLGQGGAQYVGDERAERIRQSQSIYVGENLELFI